ncbi:unnamed protein product [Protopolystoma xenopodis]|uniref:EGF-like domain-containing protein n=1 Tax=Protopolystoma xenopodis TaxID=117903 RepID=A0A3S5AF85_9PLAT|nr:unnamed protein product [Protopolystoma xenopodis]
MQAFFHQRFLDNGIALCSSPIGMRFKSIYLSQPGDFVCPWADWNDTEGFPGISQRFQEASEVEMHKSSERLRRRYGEKDPLLAPASEADTAGAGAARRAYLESLGALEKCNACLGEPCQHGGICNNFGLVNFTCACAAGWHGRRCERRMSACFGQPCENGGICKVVDQFGNFE